MQRTQKLFTTKTLFLAFSLVLLSSCGMKSLVIPHVDWGVTNRLAKQMALDSEQKKALRIDVNKYLQEQKPLAKKVARKMESFKADEIDVYYWQMEMDRLYFKALKDFLPMYSKHLAKLRPDQLPELQERFDEANEEIKENIDDEDFEDIVESFESNIGKLDPSQKDAVKQGFESFYETKTNRLNRRITYQQKLIETLKQAIKPKQKAEQIYELTWNYNKNATPSHLKSRNLQTVAKVFSELSDKQKQSLEKKISGYLEWVEYFIKEDYSS